MKRKYLTEGKVIDILTLIYIEKGMDIFNYQITNNNKLTYHHIIKIEELKSLGFPTTKTIENGIMLTNYAHSYLHLIEEFAPDIFYHLNKIILLITKEYRLPTLEERNLMQIFLEAFEYRMQEYYHINKRYLTRIKMS